MEKPYVLVTNDDGIFSPGLTALAEALEPFCRLLIAAPKSQQTSMGRGYCSDGMAGAISKETLSINGRAHAAYAVCGSPAQTVAHAVTELAEQKPDFCASGINYGENLGLALTCSGTLGACFEADSLGIPSAAFSRAIPLELQRSDRFSALDWSAEKYHAARVCKNLLEHGFSGKARLLNVNFPANCKKETDIRITRQAYMNYGKYDVIKGRDITAPHILGWARSDSLEEAPKDSDIRAVYFDGVISVTPLVSVMSVECDSYYSGG